MDTKSRIRRRRARNSTGQYWLAAAIAGAAVAARAEPLLEFEAGRPFSETARFELTDHSTQVETTRYVALDRGFKAGVLGGYWFKGALGRDGLYRPTDIGVGGEVGYLEREGFDHRLRLYGVSPQVMLQSRSAADGLRFALAFGPAVFYAKGVVPGGGGVEAVHESDAGAGLEAHATLAWRLGRGWTPTLGYRFTLAELEFVDRRPLLLSNERSADVGLRTHTLVLGLRVF